MKKLFTILAAMLFSMVGFAQTAATLTFDDKAKCTSSSASQQVWEENGIVFTNDKAASSTNVAVYAPVRLYQGSAITLKCSLGNIAQIEFICDTYKNTYPADLQKSIGAEATVSGTKVTVTPTATIDTYEVKKLAAQVRLKSVTVTYVAAGADFVPTPSIGGDDYFVEKTTVSMKAAEGAKIYYTLDGTEPTNASTEYTAPFELTETTTVKAIAYEGEKASDVVTAKFVKMQVLTCAEAAAACTSTESADKYIVRGYVTTLVDGGYSATYKNTTVWMADAADGGNVIQAFRLTPVATADQQVKVGDYIEAIGTLKKYNTTPEITGGTYTIIPVPAPAATVVAVENTTVSEMGQNLVLQGQWNEKAVTISLYPGVTKGFGVYSGEGEGDFWGTIGTADLFANGTDATYTDNGDGTFTFKATMKDATNALYEITMNGLIPVKHTYTVAGSPVAVFGTEWDPSNTANDMFLMYGTIYAWEKYNVTLSAGKIQFKVCEDHAWTTAYPASNYEFDIPASGIYTIMIMFDAASGMVEAFAEKTGDAVVIPTVAMHGNFAGPSDWKDTENFTIAEDDLTATLVMTLAVRDNYEFGMRIGGSGNWTSNGVQFTRENNSAEVVAGNGNLKLVADVAGEYTFTWTYATNTLAITFPAKEEPQPAATVVAVENTTVSEMGQNLVLQGQWNEKAVTISLYPGVTKGFGVYSGEGEGDFWGTIGTADLFANGTDATYTDNGDGTFTFKATMKDATNALYEITMNGLIPVKHTYTVAGSPVAVFGTEWDPSNTANDMFLMYGTIYAWEKYNVTLSAGKIQFKVCEDHAWTTAYPASNYEFDIPASGIYTIMIMFDAASGMVEAFAEKTGDADVIPTIVIAGDMNGWNTSANTFTIAEDEKTASLALNLEAKDYGFKMIIAGSWTSDAQTITRENNVTTYTGANGENGTLTADVAGEYIFTWTYETNTLVVTYPAKEEPQPVATWDEIVFTEVAAKGSFNGAVFAAANNAAFTLTVTDTDASKQEIDQNTASFGTAEENKAYDYRLKTGGKSSSKNGLTLAIPADGTLRIAARTGSNSATDRNLVVKQADVELYNKLVVEADKVGDYYPYIYVEVKQGNVVLEYPVNTINFYAFGFKAAEGPATGFEEIEAAEKAVKFIENGQIFILRDGAVFNLMGARVK